MVNIRCDIEKNKWYFYWGLYSIWNGCSPSQSSAPVTGGRILFETTTISVRWKLSAIRTRKHLIGSKPNIHPYPSFQNTKAVLKCEDIKGIVIATPAETHFDLAREAILAGKHVYVEKPLVLDENWCTNADRFGRNQHERILMVGHLLQYHPGHW